MRDIGTCDSEKGTQNLRYTQELCLNMCPNMYLNLVELSNYMSIVSVCEIVFSATSFHLLLNESPKVT